MTTLNDLHERAERHTLRLGNGSGVLINGNTKEYSYILTAKHVIMSCQEGGSTNCSICTRRDNCPDPVCEKLQIHALNGEQTTATEMFRSEKWDALIIKVPYQTDISLSISSDDVQIGASVTLFGYPSEARKTTDQILLQIKHFEMVKHGQVPQENKLDFRNESFADKDGVNGFSGGGLFTFDPEKDSICLIGIENRMDNAESDANHICGVMLSAYTEIIEENHLAELKPLHLSDFKQLSVGMFPQSYYQHIFPFERDKFEPLLTWVKTHCIRNLVNFSLTPLQILSDFDKYLCIDGRNSIELEDKACWERFLEFLTLVSIVNDKEFEELKPEDLFNEFKVVYLRSSEPWTEHFSEVLTVDTSSLSKNGKVLLFFNDVKGESAVIPKEQVDSCVTNICGARSDIGAIDAAETIRKEGHTLIHWASLHDENIFSQRDELNNLTGSVQGLVKVRELYRQYLEFQEGLNGQ